MQQIWLGCLAWMVMSGSVWSDDVPTEVTLPSDPSVLDARRDFGARGDGIADDTSALQRAIDASCGWDPEFRGKSNLLFIPNGVYRLTGTLVVRSGLGPWIMGESRDGVILRLDDGVENVTCVLRTHPNEEGPTSADWFMRNLRNFTIDVGDNPEVDGIRYFATNTGCLQNVRVIGRGKIGIHSGFLSQSGPNLIQDVEVEGFDIGIMSQWIWSQTLSRVTIRDCRQTGLVVSANVVAVEDLTVENTPLAIENKIPNDWGHWGGVIALVRGRFRGGDQSGPAILNHSVLYARDVRSEGYAQVLLSHTPSGSVAGDHLEEYVSSGVKRLFEDSPASSLNLPIMREPEVPWEHATDRWLCVDDFGADASDHLDDSDAIERALETAAAQGKTVVYFRGCGGSEPNWFWLKRPVRVPASVRMIIGLGWARILGEGEGGFVVDNGSAPVVLFRNIDSFGGPPIRLTNASDSHQLVVQSCGVHVIGDGSGDIFITDCPAGLELRRPGQRCWARQLNPEGNSDDGLVRNYGGDLWCLGVKHEGRGVRFTTTDGGRTEVLGLFNYGGTDDEFDPRPCFDIRDASFSIAGLREIAFDSHTAYNKVRESRDGDERLLNKEREGGWIGWSLYSGHRP